MPAAIVWLAVAQVGAAGVAVLRGPGAAGWVGGAILLPLVLGAVVADHGFEGADRAALQEKPGKLSRADPAVSPHLPENPQPRRGEQKSRDHQHRILVDQESTGLNM